MKTRELIDKSYGKIAVSVTSIFINDNQRKGSEMGTTNEQVSWALLVNYFVTVLAQIFIFVSTDILKVSSSGGYHLAKITKHLKKNTMEKLKEFVS